MGKLFVLYVLFLGLLGGCRSHCVELTLSGPISRYEKVYLDYDGRTMECLIDSVKGAKFEFEVGDVPYCLLHLGKLQVRCYVEAGQNLEVQYLPQVNRETNSRFLFDGDLKEENMLLNNSKFYGTFHMRMTEETGLGDVWGYLEGLMAENLGLLDSVANVRSLSSHFLELEKERIRYSTLGQYNRCQKWSPLIFSYLTPLMKVHEDMFALDEYMNFMRGGVYVMGFKDLDMSKIVPLDHARSQVNYIVRNLEDGKVRRALLEGVIVDYIDRNGIDSADELASLAGDGFLENSERLCSLFKEWQGLRKGSAVPQFVFTDREGNSVSLERFKGKYVFIDCWASWCSPCRKEIPYLKELEKKLEGRDIVFVGISSDNNKEKWLEALKTLGLHGEQWLEGNDFAFSKYFKVTSIPRFILLNPEGKVERSVMTRPSDPLTLKVLDGLM